MKAKQTAEITVSFKTAKWFLTEALNLIVLILQLYDMRVYYAVTTDIKIMNVFQCVNSPVMGRYCQHMSGPVSCVPPRLNFCNISLLSKLIVFTSALDLIMGLSKDSLAP